MAALTADRLGIIVTNPPYLKDGYPLADGEVIYAHSLFVLADDALFYNANTDPSPAAAVRVLYADEHLEVGPLMENKRMHFNGIDVPVAEGLYNIVVRLDAEGPLTDADVGSLAYLVDDHTISTDDADGPLVGTIQRVWSGTLADVQVDGLARDAYVDTIA